MIRATQMNGEIVRRIALIALCIAAPVVLAGCETQLSAEREYSNDFPSHAKWPQATYYTVVVRNGDSVSGIAARYNISALRLADANEISVHASLHPGEVLRVPPSAEARRAVLREATNNRLAPAPVNDDDRRIIVRREPDIRDQRVASQAAPQRKPQPQMAQQQIDGTPQVTHNGDALPVSTGSVKFAMPVDGRLIAGFGVSGNGQRNDGINIAANSGTPVHVAAEGVVTYAGNELKDYGNLILVKHADGYVTTYAHVGSIGVAPGQHVGRGDVIGTVGQTGDVPSPQLHFEIRHNMTPVDPKPLLMASRES
jgi:murein DD-endopeptidase MepM/ murein hydrolase activator NlpD